MYLGFGTWKSNLCFLFYLFIWSRFCCKFQLSNATSICTKNKQRQLFLVAAYFAFYKLFLFSRPRPRLHPSPPLSLCQHPIGRRVCVCVPDLCVYLLCLLEQQCNIKKSHFAVDLFCNFNRTFRHRGTFKCKACKTMLRILNLPEV